MTKSPDVPDLSRAASGVYSSTYGESWQVMLLNLTWQEYVQAQHKNLSDVFSLGVLCGSKNNFTRLKRINIYCYNLIE